MLPVHLKGLLGLLSIASCHPLGLVVANRDAEMQQLSTSSEKLDRTNCSNQSRMQVPSYHAVEYALLKAFKEIDRLKRKVSRLEERHSADRRQRANMIRNLRTELVPGSCSDLSRNGHVLSGFYPVMGADHKVDMVFCDFSRSPAEPGYENRIGFVDIKTSRVEFYVQRTSSYSKGNTTVPFEVDRLNVGGAMNLSTGVFTAPRPGTYAFALSAVKDFSPSYTDIEFRVNGVSFGDAFAPESSDLFSLSIHATLKLAAGDQVTLFLYSGTLYSVSNIISLHYTGWMVDEDLTVPAASAPKNDSSHHR